MWEERLKLTARQGQGRVMSCKMVKALVKIRNIFETKRRMDRTVAAQPEREVNEKQVIDGGNDNNIMFVDVYTYLAMAGVENIANRTSFLPFEKRSI